MDWLEWEYVRVLRLRCASFRMTDLFQCLKEGVECDAEKEGQQHVRDEDAREKENAGAGEGGESGVERGALVECAGAPRA